MNTDRSLPVVITPDYKLSLRCPYGDRARMMQIQNQMRGLFILGAMCILPPKVPAEREQAMKEVAKNHDLDYELIKGLL